MTFTFTISNACFQNGNLPFNKFEFLVMWLFRECGAPYLFLHAILNPDVSWRSQRFRSAQSIELETNIREVYSSSSSKYWEYECLQCECSRLKWGGEVEPVLVPRTKADIVKEPSSVKFSSPEEITPLPQHVKRHSRHNSLQLRHEILKMEKDVISDWKLKVNSNMEAFCWQYFLDAMDCTRLQYLIASGLHLIWSTFLQFLPISKPPLPIKYSPGPNADSIAPRRCLSVHISKLKILYLI